MTRWAVSLSPGSLAVLWTERGLAERRDAARCYGGAKARSAGGTEDAASGMVSRDELRRDQHGYSKTMAPVQLASKPKAARESTKTLLVIAFFKLFGDSC